MKPQVVRITEGNKIDRNGVVSKVNLITYTVGSFGPFTLEATSDEIRNGTANQRMNEFATTIMNLPVEPSIGA